MQLTAAKDDAEAPQVDVGQIIQRLGQRRQQLRLPCRRYRHPGAFWRKDHGEATTDAECPTDGVRADIGVAGPLVLPLLLGGLLEECRGTL